MVVKKLANLKSVIKETFKDIKKNSNQSTILFAPACASYDQYKNFEERGKQFNMLIKRYLPIEWINILIHFMIGGKTSIKQFFW